MGYLKQYPCGEQKRTKQKIILFLNTQFYLNQRWVDTLTMFYVEKNRCLILNPASHLKLHDNLHGGYFKEIKFVVKLTYKKSENPYSQIDVNIDGIPYHTKEEEVEL
jgi:hypothetical protein